MVSLGRQNAARRIVGRLETFKRHLIDMIIASEPEDTEIYAKALLLRAGADALIAEYVRMLDYPPPAKAPSTAAYLCPESGENGESERESIGEDD